jgi:hypothetical protein
MEQVALLVQSSWRERVRVRGIVSGFTLTLILSRSPYPSGSKSSLDACPPFLPRERKKVELKA